MSIHPLGQYVATSSQEDRLVKVWEIATGRRVSAVAVPGDGPIPIVWSPGGRELYYASGSSVLRAEFRVPDIEHSVAVGTKVDAASFSRHDDRLLIARPFNGAEQLLDVISASHNRIKPATNTVANKDGRGQLAIATHSSQDLAFITRKQNGSLWWNSKRNQLRDALPGELHSPVYSRDGKAIWAIDDSGHVRCWNVDNSALAFSWKYGPGSLLSGKTRLSSLAVGNNIAITGGDDGNFHILDPVNFNHKSCNRSPNCEEFGVSLVGAVGFDAVAQER